MPRRLAPRLCCFCAPPNYHCCCCWLRRRRSLRPLPVSSTHSKGLLLPLQIGSEVFTLLALSYTKAPLDARARAAAKAVVALPLSGGGGPRAPTRGASGCHLAAAGESWVLGVVSWMGVFSEVCLQVMCVRGNTRCCYAAAVAACLWQSCLSATPSSSAGGGNGRSTQRSGSGCASAAAAATAARRRRHRAAATHPRARGP